MKALTFRQIRDRLNDLTDKQLGMTATVALDEGACDGFPAVRRFGGVCRTGRRAALIFRPAVPQRPED